MTTIRVVVADDHPMVRYGITAVLAGEPDIEVVAEASDGEELVAAVTRTYPDLVITDLAMPKLNGIGAIARLRHAAPDAPVLVLTMHADDESVFAALRAGARGYLIKGTDAAELVRAIRSVAAGDAVYGAPIAARLIASFTGSAPAAQPFADLTQREREVLDLLAAGLRNHAIAARLDLAEKTVRNHVSAVLIKLQVSDRTAAAIKAREAGLGDH
ncbi:response regulator [Smaragdicoccus niigatensis]|uniref:response regulator n=1 Tax=Smaragdicoccus niigatensis TaxID=359359 RepID=UPI00037939AF|nr:response regulator transcription factor [Smaragdicoccus niigatensis]